MLKIENSINYFMRMHICWKKDQGSEIVLKKVSMNINMRKESIIPKKQSPKNKLNSVSYADTLLLSF